MNRFKKKAQVAEDSYKLPDDVSDSLQELVDRKARSRKIPIALRVDEDVLEYFKSLGRKGYQTWMHQALEQWIAGRRRLGAK